MMSTVFSNYPHGCTVWVIQYSYAQLQLYNEYYEDNPTRTA